MVLMDECLIGTAGSPDDLRALAWIAQSLEDIEATITGLARSEEVTDGGTLPRVSGSPQAVRRAA